MARTAGRLYVDQPVGPDLWVSRGACTRPGAASMELAASGPQARAATERLLQVCRHCPVLAECRAWALTEPDPAIGHVAGGLTPTARAAHRKHEASS